MTKVSVLQNKYIIDNVPYFRVSEVLSFLTSKKYQSIPPNVMKTAAQYGTEVHWLLEQWLLGNKKEVIETIKNTNDVIKANAISNFDTWVKRKNIVEFETEKLHYANINEINIAGTIDLKATINGEKYIIDYKVRNIVNIKDLLTESLQLLLYKKLVGNRKAKLMIVVIDRRSGDLYEHEVIETEELKNLLQKLLDLFRVYIVNGKVSINFERYKGE